MRSFHAQHCDNDFTYEKIKPAGCPLAQTTGPTTNRPHASKTTTPGTIWYRAFQERVIGFEPTTFTLAT